jgi:ABC-2 type transport system permease protein
MSAVAVESASPTTTTRTAPARIRQSRVVAVELRKMFDTRSGFWLLAGIVILSVIATGAVIAFAADRDITYNSFGAAVGIPMTVILPVIAILSVTGEWSQRNGLTTFTLVPHRGRVIRAKLVCAVAVGAVSMLVAFGVGALGNVLGSSIRGTDLVWDMSVGTLLDIVLANVLGLLVGFTLGVLVRSSAGAVVGYFVYSFVLPPLAGLLAASQSWWRDVQPWVDFNFAQTALYDGGLTGQQWAHLAVSGTVWLALPLAVGLALVLRSEVK